MEEFLNPKATMTPGALGGLMMLLANTICQFFPDVPFRYAALLLSFLIATIAFSNFKASIPKRIALWSLNALVIFSVGVGSSNVVANINSSHAGHASLDGSDIGTAESEFDKLAQEDPPSVLPKQGGKVRPPPKDDTSPPAVVPSEPAPPAVDEPDPPVSIGGSIREDIATGSSITSHPFFNRW